MIKAWEIKEIGTILKQFTNGDSIFKLIESCHGYTVLADFKNAAETYILRHNTDNGSISNYFESLKNTRLRK